jgi:hypothetical protein
MGSKLNGKSNGKRGAVAGFKPEDFDPVSHAPGTKPYEPTEDYVATRIDFNDCRDPNRPYIDGVCAFCGQRKPDNRSREEKNIERAPLETWRVRLRQKNETAGNLHGAPTLLDLLPKGLSPMPVRLEHEDGVLVAYLEAPRWYAAREKAMALFGVSQDELEIVMVPDAPPPP